MDPQRVQNLEQNTQIFGSIHPDQYLAAGLGSLSQLFDGGAGIIEVVHDANAEGNIKLVLVGNVVNAAMADGHSRVGQQIVARRFQ